MWTGGGRGRGPTPGHPLGRAGGGGGGRTVQELAAGPSWI